MTDFVLSITFFTLVYYVFNTIEHNNGVSTTFANNFHMLS